MVDTLRAKGVRLVVAALVRDEVRGEVRDRLRRIVGADAFFDTLGDVATAYRSNAWEPSRA